MEVSATAKHVRMSPQRGRAVARELSGLEIDQAMATLAFMPNRAAAEIAKVVKSAAANAEHNYALDRDALRIQSVVVNDGPALRRHRPRSRGRVGMYLKRSGHITVTVEDGMT
ncbi:MAG: 50S ribosomal protein L22 [Chloroflexota bacterium]|nr:50S ribosomal protein L22 [Chloroflexota bacterium]